MFYFFTRQELNKFNYVKITWNCQLGLLLTLHDYNLEAAFTQPQFAIWCFHKLYLHFLAEYHNLGSTVTHLLSIPSFGVLKLTVCQWQSCQVTDYCWCVCVCVCKCNFLLQMSLICKETLRSSLLELKSIKIHSNHQPFSLSSLQFMFWIQ
jgi:hypothetical protein